MPPRSPEDLAKAIVDLFSDKKRLGWMGRQSRKTALKHEWEITIGKIERLYGGLVQ